MLARSTALLLTPLLVLACSATDPSSSDSVTEALAQPETITMDSPLPEGPFPRHARVTATVHLPIDSFGNEVFEGGKGSGRREKIGLTLPATPTFRCYLDWPADTKLPTQPVRIVSASSIRSRRIRQDSPASFRAFTLHFEQPNAYDMRTIECSSVVAGEGEVPMVTLRQVGGAFNSESAGSHLVLEVLP